MTPSFGEVQDVVDAPGSAVRIMLDLARNQSFCFEIAHRILDRAFAEARRICDAGKRREALTGMTVVSVRKDDEDELGGRAKARLLHRPGGGNEAHAATSTSFTGTMTSAPPVSLTMTRG